LKKFGGADSWDRIEPILLKLAGDSDPAVRSAATGTIAHWMAGLDGFGRARLVMEWAVSEAAAIRLTLAQALSFGIPSFGADLAVEHLGQDEDPAIRIAAIEAAKNRFPENPDSYHRILKHLSLDKRRSVRKAARRAIVLTGDNAHRKGGSAQSITYAIDR
jgi:hypothetical protein